MVGFDKLGQAMGIFGGLGNLGTSLAGAYLGAPKAQSNEGYKKAAQMVGNWDFGTSDMAGLMSQYGSLPTLHNITGKDLYNPSTNEMFSSLFGSGMGAYGAMSGLTNSMYRMGTSTPSDSNKITVGGKEYDASSLLDSAVKTQENLKISATANGIISQNPYMRVDIFSPYDNVGETRFRSCGGHLRKCGGHLHGCGGHKYISGGALSGIGTGLNIGAGLLGVGLNALGIQDQKREAKMMASEVNAANMYARQLMQHNFNEAVYDTKNNMFNQQALQMMAMGGDLQTHGADFSLLGDYNIIGAGGTHEQNPFGGVYQGMAADGKPNLVEEDEVVWNDYVFSNRLTVPKEFAKARKLKEGITYAQAAQKLSKEAEERPNDPISQNGLADALSALMENQEELKQQREAARIKRQIAKMSPEEVMNMMAAFQAAQQQQQPVVEQPMFADGGHLYAWGGLDKLFNVNPYAASNLAQYLPYDRNRVDARDEEAKDSYKAWTDYVKDNWDSEEVQKYLKALDAKAGGNHLFDKNGKIKEGAKDYFLKARTDGKWGYYHLTPTQLAAASSAQDQPKGDSAPSEGKKAAENPAEEVMETTEGYEDPFAPLPTLSRYAPVVGSAIGAIAATAPAKDYSTGFTPRMAKYTPIGDYLPYMPIDTQRYINAENQQAAAQLNAIMNASAGNRNMALAQAALANQQRQQAIGQRMQAAEAINWDRLRQASEFNRGTNMFNAQAFNQSELANLHNNPLLLRQEQQNAAMKHAVDSERDAAISQNLTALFDNLGDIGRENFIFNQANSNKALLYGVGVNPLFGGWSYYQAPDTVTKGAPSAKDSKKKSSDKTQK